MARKSKHVRLPNGFGSITFLKKQNLRKPWMARKTIGKTEFGKPILKVIGYFETYNKAYAALIDYNKNPYAIEATQIKFSEVYEKWSNEHFKKVSTSAIRGFKSSYNYCTGLKDMAFAEIKVSHIEGTIRDCGASDIMKSRIKNLISLMYKWAIKHEITDKNYAKMCDEIKEPKPKICREVFSQEEITQLWANSGNLIEDIILIAIYSGWRPSELLNIKKESINLSEKTMTGGSKTEAGLNRVVPIHNTTFPLLQQYYDSNNTNPFLFILDSKPLNYNKYLREFDRTMAKYNFNHKPHDARHTFITKSKLYEMDDNALKLIVGHTITDITERIYTHRTIEWLNVEINKII